MKSLAAVAILLFVSSIAQSQSTNRITEKVDSASSVRIEHSKHPLLNSAKDLGRVDGSLKMNRMMLLLKPSPVQEEELKRLIASQQDKQSPNYHQWVTPAGYAVRFGPSQADLNQISGWLRQQGFTVGAVANGKQWIEFSGNAAQVESAFRTEMHHFSVNGEKHIANATDISIPRALAPVVHGVLSLHDFRAKPLHKTGYRVRRDPATGKLAPVSVNKAGVQTGATPDFTQPGRDRHFITPGDWAKIYNTTPLLTTGTTGSGISIAVVGADSDVQLSDIRTFRQIFGLPAKDPVFIVNGTDPGVFAFSDAEVEADLDIEWAGAIAPDATIKFVTSASTAASDGFSLSLAYIVDNRVAPIMSNSIGGCEMFFGEAGNAFLNNLFRQAAAEGISVISAAGDSGAAGCDPQQSFNPASRGPAVNAAASTPYDVAIGGTMFAENGQDDNFWDASNRSDLASAKGYIPEAIWNETCDLSTDPNGCFGTGFFILSAGSGGPSSCTASIYAPETDTFTCTAGGYPKPSWQAGTGVPDDGVRDIPDISFTAAAGHDGYLMCVEGSCQSTITNGQTVLTDAFIVGGTSAGAPAFSGVMALLEQKKQAYQGLLNFNLYQLAAQDDLAACDSSTLTDPSQRADCTFYDTTAGNNDVPGQPGANAAPGFDLASGLGSVNVAKLVAGWDSAAKLPSNTTLSINDPRDFEHGQPIPLRVFVRPTRGAGSPSGDISFVTDTLGSVIGGSLKNGSFTGGVRNLPGGDYQVKAHYTGDAMFAASDSQGTRVKIRPEPSALEIQEWDLSPVSFQPSVVLVDGPVAYGQPVGLQMNVTGRSGVSSPSGNVTILMDGKQTFAPLKLNQSGNAFFWLYNTEPAGITPGTHRFSVSYEGDNSFKATTATAAPLVIEKAGAIRVAAFPLQTSIDPNNFTNVMNAGAPVDILVEIGPWFDVLWGLGKQLPTGKIQMYECFSQLDDFGDCTGPWVPNGASQTLSPNGPLGPLVPQTVFRRSFTAGDHTLRYTYSGDTNYVSLLLDAPGGRTSLGTLTVDPAPSAKINLTQQAAAINIGQSAAYTISVKPAHTGSPVPTGTVSLVDVFNNQIAGPVNLVNGSASFAYPWYIGGQQMVYAFYWGDGNYAALASPSIVTNVSQIKAALTLTSSAASVTSGGTTTLAAVLPAPPNPNIPPAGALDFYQQQGQVQYWDSVNGGPLQLLGAAPQFLTVGNGNTSVNAMPIVLPPGRNVITAKFLGTSDWAAATSNAVVVNVK